MQKDPHTWLDPKIVKVNLDIILESIIALDPTNSEFYNTNYKALLDQLDKLNDRIESIKRCNNPQFLTNHDGFGYMSSRLGLIVTPITELNENETPSAQKLEELTQLIKTQKIKHILIDKNSNQTFSNKLIELTGISAVPMNTMESKDENNDFSFFNLYKNNLNAILEVNKCVL